MWSWTYFFFLGTLRELLLPFLQGTLLLRYRASRFACAVPTWRLLPAGNAAGLVTEGGEEVGLVGVEPAAGAVLPAMDGSGGVLWMTGPGGDVKRVRLTRKKLLHTSFVRVFGGFNLGHVLGRG